MTAALMVAALALDSLTYLMIEPHEANPLVVALGPGLALLIRWSIVVGLLVLAHFVRHKRRIYVLGAVVGLIGAAANTRTLIYYGIFQ